MSTEIDIPIFEIPLKGKRGVNKPTELNADNPASGPQTGIDNSLNASLGLFVNFEEFGTENFRIVPFYATSPHTPEGHMVFWIDPNRKGTPKVRSWEQSDWQQLYEDPFLDQFQSEYVPSLQEVNPELRAYIYLGVNKPVVTKPGFVPPSQSQIRPHFHMSEAIEDFPHHQIFRVDENAKNDSDHFEKYRNMLNFAGEQAIKDHRELFDGFGTPFKYHQQIGIGQNQITLERTMFAFNGPTALKDAIKASRELQEKITPGWEEYIEKLKNEKVEFLGQEYELVQSSIPNMAIIIPSKMDRINGQVDNDAPVWVLPLSTAGALVLAHGGAISDRATPYDKK